MRLIFSFPGLPSALASMLKRSESIQSGPPNISRPLGGNSFKYALAIRVRSEAFETL
jgi:hypothetical protein